MPAYQAILTDVGSAKIATAIVDETPLALATMAVGDGAGAPVTPTAGQTALVNEVFSAALNRLDTDPDDASYIIVEMIIPVEEGPYFIREVGVFDDDEDLIAVANFPETYKPVAAEGSVRDLVVRLYINVGSASAVTLSIDPSVVLASRSWTNQNHTRQVDSVYSLLSVLHVADDQQIMLAGYHPESSVGGGLFRYDAARAKADHDGGIVISPTVPWDGEQSTLAAFLAGTGETDGGGNGCWVRITKRPSVDDWGAIADGDGVGGGTDNGPIFNLIPVASIKSIHFSGVYRADEQVIWTSTTDLKITADPGTVIDMTGSTDYQGLALFSTAPPGNDVSNLFDRTIRTGSQALGADVSKGDLVITVPTALGLAAGDIARISSSDLFNSARVTYWAGELVRVKSVTSDAGTDTVTLDHQLYDSYVAANTKVWKLNSPKFEVRDITVLRDGDYVGVGVWESVGASVENVTIHGARAQAIQIAYCYGWSVRNCRSNDSWFLGAGSAYGLQVTSSQHGSATSSHFAGGRHAVEFGGYEPCRDFVVAHNTIETHHGEGDGAFDTHGNTEYYEVHSNHIIGGMSVNPTNSYIHDNTIFDRGGIDVTNGGDSTAIRYNVEMNSEYTICRNNIVIGQGGGSAAASEDRGQFTIALLFAEADCVLDRVDIEGIKARGAIGFAHGMIHISPFVVAATGGVINKLNLINNDMELLSGSSSSAHCVFITDGGFGSSNEIEIGEMRVLGGRYESSGGRVFELDPHTDSGTLEMDGVKLIDNDVGLLWTPATTGNFTTARIRNCTAIRASSGASKFDLWGHTNIEFMDNWLENLSTDGGLDFRGATLSVVRNNRLVNCGGNFYIEGQVVESVGGAAHQKKVTYGSAAPASGTWAVGDRCWNTAPAPAGTAYWACTVAGTPGTWTAHAL